MTNIFIGIFIGIALDEAYTRGWLKLGFDKVVAMWKARGVK